MLLVYVATSKKEDVQMCSELFWGFLQEFLTCWIFRT